MDKQKEITIVIPAYNEESNISSTLEDIKLYIEKSDYSYELIIVDDGSSDKTVEIASSHKDSFDSFSLIENRKNRGKGYSVKQGMLRAKGKYVLFMDADNSTRIDQIEKLIQAIDGGNDVAIGSRRVPGAQIDTSQPFYRIFLGNIYIILSKILIGSSVSDYNCGFKLYKNEVVDCLFKPLTMNNWSFDSELIYLVKKYNLKIKEVPVRWEDKQKTSKVKPLRDGINSLLSLIKIRINAIKKVYD